MTVQDVDARLVSAIPIHSDGSVVIEAPHLAGLANLRQKMWLLGREECHAGAYLAAQGNPGLQDTRASAVHLFHLSAAVGLKPLAVAIALAIAIPTSLACSMVPDTSSNVIRVPQDVATVQEAVGAAGPRDVVRLDRGSYPGGVVVPQSKRGITIRGVDRNAVVFDGADRRDNAIVVHADGVALRNPSAHNFLENGFYWDGVRGFSGSYLTVWNVGLPHRLHDLARSAPADARHSPPVAAAGEFHSREHRSSQCDRGPRTLRRSACRQLLPQGRGRIGPTPQAPGEAVQRRRWGWRRFAGPRDADPLDDRRGKTCYPPGVLQGGPATAAATERAQLAVQSCSTGLRKAPVSRAPGPD